MKRRILVLRSTELAKARKDGKVPVKQLVTRDGKSFMQTFWVSPAEAAQMQDAKQPMIGETIIELLGMAIVRYSDKAIVVKGDTKSNLAALRSLKSDLGVGSWNSKIGGWVFPYAVADRVYGTLAANAQAELDFAQDQLPQKIVDVPSTDQIKKPTLKQFTDAREELRLQVIELNAELDAAKKNKSDQVWINMAQSKLKELTAQMAKNIQAEFDIVFKKDNADAVAKFLDRNPGLRGTDAFKEDFKELDKIRAAQDAAGLTKEEEKKIEAVAAKMEPIIEAVKIELADPYAPGTLVVFKEPLGKNRGKMRVGRIKEIKRSTRHGMDYATIEFADPVTMVPTGVEDNIWKRDLTIVPENDPQKANELLQSLSPENRYKVGARLVGGYKAPTDAEEAMQVSGAFSPKQVEIETADFIRKISTSQSERNPSIKLKADDWSRFPSKDVIINKKSKEWPKFLPEISAADFKHHSNLIPAVILGSDKLLIPLGFNKNSQNGKNRHPEYAIVNQAQYSAMQSLALERAKREQQERKARGYKAQRVAVIPENKISSLQAGMIRAFIEQEVIDSNRALWDYYAYVRNTIKTASIDFDGAIEDHENSYKKGVATSFGTKNTTKEMLDSHGILVKRQNGDPINTQEVNELKQAFDQMFQIFGDRSSVARKWGMVVSHTGEKRVFARKAIGLYIPRHRTIVVGNSGDIQGMGFVLSHEYAHFFDNYLGGNYRFASEQPGHIANRIANLARDKYNVTKSTSGAYWKRSTECFARAMEQYAVETHGDAKEIEGYRSMPGYFKAEVMDQLRPLIREFFETHNEALKAAHKCLIVLKAKG